MMSALAALKYAKTTGVIIIVDDCKDTPLDQAAAYFQAPNIHVVVNQGAQGPAGARNFGARQTQSTLLFFLDDDDLMELDYVDRILTQRRSGVCAAKWGFCRRYVERTESSLPDQSAMLSQNIPLRRRLVATCHGFWVERMLFEKLGGFDEALQINEDTDFCITLAAADYFPWYESEPGVRLNGARQAGNADRPSTTKSIRAATRASAWQYIVDKHAALLKKHPAERMRFVSKLAKFRARSGNFRGALTIAFAQERNKQWSVLLQIAVGVATREQ
jgi:glycosyltransferase involved in cell wall biosynthesis